MTSLTDTPPRPWDSPATPVPDHLPRLLPADARTAPTSLAEHLARYGPPPSIRSARERATLIEEVVRAGLTGRGGAGFPTARKLAAVAAGRRPVVVANGTEGEPASAKDKVLLAQSPHLVLDGAAIAAAAIGADRAVVVAHHSVREIVDDAVAQRRRAGSDRIGIEVVTGADRFVGGEASAVIHWIERGVPTPTRTPPRLSERGLGGRPTLVQNVETLAHLALIARYGHAWFRAVGTTEHPGSMLVTVLGAVHRPRVQEIAIGTPIRQVLGLCDGSSAPLQALLLGGYSGTWVPATGADLPFSPGGLVAAGAGVGAGLIAALPDDVCGLAETAGVVRYLADESAGQCGPCRYGLDGIAAELCGLAEGSRAEPMLLLRWLDQVDGRGGCHHPDGVVRLIRSALTVFAPELARHARGGCRATRAARILPVPPRRRP